MAKAPAAGLEDGVGNLSLSDGVEVKPFQLTLDVLTANIKGDKKRTITDRQKFILECFFSEHQPDVILVQENLWPGNNIRLHLASIGGNYDAENIPKKCETVLHRFTNSPKLEAKGNNLHEVLVNAYAEKKFVLTHNVEDLLARVRVVSFIAKGPFAETPEPHLIAISWHGPNKRRGHVRSQSSTGTESRSSSSGIQRRSSTGESDVREYKKQVFCDLLTIVKYLNESLYSKHVPVILGGDFNIDCRYVQNLISLNELQLIKYPMPPSREQLQLLDFFIVSREVSLNGAYAIPYEMDPDGRIFGHVPVLARFGLTLHLPFKLTKVRK